MPNAHTKQTSTCILNAKISFSRQVPARNMVFEGKYLSHFVTNKKKMFFELFGIHDVTEYCSDSLRSHVNALKFVNDTAERGIALIKKYNESVRAEQQKQFLLRVVEHHRKVVTRRTKQGIASFKVD